MAAESVGNALIHPFHPIPTGAVRGNQGHGDSIHAFGTTGGEIREVGGHGTPAHIAGIGCGITEVDAIHQHIGVDQQRSWVCGKTGGVVVELACGGKACQPSQQLGFPEIRQGLAHA